MKRVMISIAVIATILLVLGDFTFTYRNNDKSVRIEYNGVLWVVLDYWSIWRYDSEDAPMRILKITHQ